MYRLRESALQQFTHLPARPHAAGSSPEKV